MKITICDKIEEFKNVENIIKFIKSIDKPEEVTFLKLSGNIVNLDVAAKLNLKIKQMTRLKHLHFWLYDSSSSKENTDLIINLFKSINPLSIKTLNIYLAFFEFKLPSALCKFLTNAKNLEYLHLLNWRKRSTEILSVLEKMIELKTELKYLSISAFFKKKVSVVI
ncbi:hypothetical protein CDIK_3535 [Cucumispora dikerogammari]|nr:hypothetical protein CDIK_3535 [Cucumispora dikerogammari]